MDFQRVVQQEMQSILKNCCFNTLHLTICTVNTVFCECSSQQVLQCLLSARPCAWGHMTSLLPKPLFFKWLHCRSTMMELFSSAGLNTRGLTADRCLDLNVSNNYNGARVTTSLLPRLNASTDLIQTTISIQWLHTHLQSKNSIAANYNCVCKSHYAPSVWRSNTEILPTMALFIPSHAS